MSIYEKHGLTKIPEYKVWKSMKYRCSNPNLNNYKDYGGRGIKVCDRWLSFTNFIEDMGRRPSNKHSIERVNNDGNYEPSNCEWATTDKQSANKRQTLLTHFDKTQTVPQWANELGIDRRKIYWRLKKGWTTERALGF